MPNEATSTYSTVGLIISRNTYFFINTELTEPENHNLAQHIF